MTEEEVSNVDKEEKQEKTENLSEEDALKEEIRRFTGAVSDPSVRVHGMAYTSLAKLCEQVAEVPPPYVKGLVEMSVTNSIRLYGQPKSFQYVQRLLQVLSKRDYTNALKSLLATITASLPIVSNLSESKSQAQVPTMKWLLMMLSAGKSENLSENALENTGTLATISYLMSGNDKAWRIFTKKFGRISKELTPIIESKITELAKDHQEKSIALIAAVGAVSSGTPSDIFLQTFTDLLSKCFLLAKLRPPQFLANCSSKFVIFLREKQDFTENLLPNIKKALLRSPEVAIFGIQGIIENTPYPLDSCAQDLLKSTVSQLSNADSGIREAAIAIAVALTKKSDVPVIQKVLNTMFDQFAAATAPEVKISLMEGIGRIAGSVEIKEIDKVADEVLGKTAKADKEAHDGTIEDRLSKPTFDKKLERITSQLGAMHVNPEPAVETARSGRRDNDPEIIDAPPGEDYNGLVLDDFPPGIGPNPSPPPPVPHRPLQMRNPANRRFAVRIQIPMEQYQNLQAELIELRQLRNHQLHRRDHREVVQEARRLARMRRNQRARARELRAEREEIRVRRRAQAQRRREERRRRIRIRRAERRAEAERRAAARREEWRRMNNVENLFGQNQEGSGSDSSDERRIFGRRN